MRQEQAQTRQENNDYYKACLFSLSLIATIASLHFTVTL